MFLKPERKPNRINIWVTVQFGSTRSKPVHKIYELIYKYNNLKINIIHNESITIIVLKKIKLKPKF